MMTSPRSLCIPALIAGALFLPGSDGPAPAWSSSGAQTVIANPHGDCLTLRDRDGDIIENLLIGPCAGHGISLVNSRNVTFRRVTILDTEKMGLYILGSQGIVVEESRITNTLSGIHAQSSTAVKVRCNTFIDVRGPIPRGQFVQFNTVSGAGNAVRCNAMRSRPGRGIPEDAISLYRSSGLPQSPILVERNLIVGGGPSQSGGGIMLGDDGGAHAEARANILVDPGQYGIAVASGHDFSILGNLVFARAQPFTNVGISVWNQYASACRDVTVLGNRVRWTGKDGRPNPYWNAGNCGPVKGESDNTLDAPLTAEIASLQEPDCECRTAGRGR
jgi:hypothetical protein